MFQPLRRQQDTNSSLSLVPSTSDPVASSSHQASLSTPALPPSDTTVPSSSAVQETASSSSTVYEPPANSSSEPISTSSIAPSSTSAPSFNPPPPPSSSDPTPPSSTPYTPPYTPPASSPPYTPPYTPPVTPTDTIPYTPPSSSPPFTPSPSSTPNPSTYSPWSYDPPIMSSDTLSISVSTPVQPPSSTLSSSTPAPSGPSSTLTTMSTPQPPPSSSSSTGSSSSSSSGGNGGLDTVTSTSSSGPSSSSNSSTPGSSSSPSSSSSSSTPTSSSSSGGGGLDTVTSTSSASSSSSPSDTGGSTPSSPPQNDSATPTTTFSTPVSLTMTNSQGSVFVTSPSEITTVVVTTVPNGSFTTLTEIIANPPGVLNSGDRSPASTFFKNRGAVAGVFVTAALALCAMILFVVFALRRRRQRLQRERDAEIAAGLAAAAMSQRFTDDGDHPVVMRSVPSSRLAMRRSPLPDDEDDDERIAYSATGAPIMYSNPHMMPMAVTRDTAYPISPARYGALGAAAAANRSRTPSPSKDPFANPVTTIIEPASPVANANSGWSSYGALYAGQRSQSVSPVPTTSAPASAHHGTNFGAATSTGHVPSSYHTVPPYRPPTTASSSGKDGSSGSGGSTSVPGTIQPPVPTMTMTTTSRSNLDRSSSPALSSVYPPEYEQFASVENGSGNEVGYAYEPEPVQHSRQITAGMLPVPGFDSPRQSNDDDEAYSGIRSPLSGSGVDGSSGAGGAGDLGRTASVGSRSMYSQDASAEWDEHDRMPREDPRLDPLMRMHGGLVSAASMGQTDHLDYMRRVQPQALNSPSTVSHSQSTH